MSGTRYTATQIGDAISRCARGSDARAFLLLALTDLQGAEADEVLVGLVDHGDLQAREWFVARNELSQRHPRTFLAGTILQGLASRSIDVQQMVVAGLPDWARDGLLNEEDISLALQWLDRRLRNPRRESTRALWEVADVVLAVAITQGLDAAHQALAARMPRLTPDEKDMATRLPPASSGDYINALQQWSNVNKGGGPENRYDDPTATRYIDRVMRRLRIEPANPDVQVFTEPWENFEQRMVISPLGEP